MKVALIGASGNVGSRILIELLNRGHEVTGIVRHTEKLPRNDRLTAKRGDINDEARLAQLLGGHDAVISAVRFQSTDAQSLIEAVKRAGIKRLLVVGGAGSLEVAPGQFLKDSPDFPAVARPTANAQAETLVMYRASPITWTFFCPSRTIQPGRRTGKYRRGGDQLLTNDLGESYISVEDYAFALLDEIEQPQAVRQRFTAVSLEK